jgi:phytoene/squalene synthetase
MARSLRYERAMEPFATCAAEVRKHDPDRYFSALFAPQALRPHLFALYAFNGALAEVAASVREPMLGAIRLQWWREALDKPTPHDVVRAVTTAIAEQGLPRALFDAMIDARARDLDPAPFADRAERDAYLDATSANVMRLASRILGGGDRFDKLAYEAGLAYGLTGLLRNRKLEGADVADEARGHLARARRLPKPGAVLPAFLPATLVPLYLRDPRRDIPIHRRQIALLGGTLRGRV